MALRVGVFGAGGRMGSTVCRAVDDDPTLDLVAAVDPHHVGLDMHQVTGVDEPFLVAADGQAFLDAGAQVVVDFTHVDAARENLLFLAENGIHAVTGTTGFSDDDYARFGAAFTRSNCVIAPNFAIGAVLMMRFAELAAPYFETAEIIELHHDSKLDAPSGTAMLTAERMAAASAQWAPDPTKTEILAGRPGRQGPGRHPGALAAAAGDGGPPGGHPRHHRARPCRSGTTPTTGRRSCPAWCWP